MDHKSKGFDFGSLVSAICQAHEHLAARAGRAINISLTMRNWIIGAYIDEYELRGSDRAVYGEKLLETLTNQLRQLNISNCNRRQLYRYLRFYRLYPEIVGTLSPQLPEQLLFRPDRSRIKSLRGKKEGTVSPQLKIAPERLVRKLSYSHLEQIVDLDDPLKRTFYEIECIRGNWSVRELKRQIASLYYERSGLSENKEKLAELARAGAECADAKPAIRDPYVFEFLGLKPAEVMSESRLEEQLLTNLQSFLLELGHGFCFEARQKRLLIGDTHGFVDLVFYHRILKCHVLVELKIDAFTHENLGQLNTYVSWFRTNMMGDGDNPPVGILLCTQKDQALVEYALAGMDNNLFVSRYQLELPPKEEIQRFVEEKMREVGDGE